MQLVHRTRWLVNRAAAALVGATAVGLVGYAILAISNGLTCGPICTSWAGHNDVERCVEYASTCTNFWPSEIGSLIIVLAVALVFGTPPGFLALTATPAKERPWTSLPLLVAGTSIGVATWMYLVVRSSLGDGPFELPLLFAFPTLTGLATAKMIGRRAARSGRRSS